MPFFLKQQTGLVELVLELHVVASSAILPSLAPKQSSYVPGPLGSATEGFTSSIAQQPSSRHTWYSAVFQTLQITGIASARVRKTQAANGYPHFGRYDRRGWLKRGRTLLLLIT